jgi:aldehyde dehydrogenase (NAD+)
MGVAGLIVPANTPLANVANKVFPALICGNAVVLKAAEDAPLSADAFARIAHESGLPRGVLNVVQGLGSEAGAPLVDASVDVISFTGSTAVGRQIAAKAGESLVKTSLELGGKNALVVCDDADLENAVKWSLLSSFSNAGQRCASSSRIIAFDAIYDRFRAALVERTKALRVGVSDSDDLGPVISERHLERLIQSVERARAEGTTVLCGGSRLQDPAHASGYYLAPTVLDGMSVDAHVSQEELFGPITCLYRVRNLEEAIALTNRSRYGLTSAIHTANVHRAMEFVRRSRAGVTTVNRGTYGSEPHMPFGGMGQSGNGTREPGTEALDVYSQLKNVHIGFDSRLA